MVQFSMYADTHKPIYERTVEGFSLGFLDGFGFDRYNLLSKVTNTGSDKMLQKVFPVACSRGGIRAGTGCRTWAKMPRWASGVVVSVHSPLHHWRCHFQSLRNSWSHLIWTRFTYLHCPPGPKTASECGILT